jgi:hypothetical protein
MTSHVDHQHRTKPLCAVCQHREAVTFLNPRQKSRKAKRGGGCRLAHHDLCKLCWRRLCARFWVHAGSAFREAAYAG